MAIQIRTVTPGVSNAIRSLTPQNASMLMSMDGGGLAEPSAAFPTPIYTLGLSEAAAQMSPQPTDEVRYLVTEQGEPVGTAHVANIDASGFKIHELGGGSPASTSFPRAYDLLDSVPAVNEGEFELRALTVPSLYVSALWAFSAETSFFALLDPVFPPFEAEKAYDGEEFSSLLAEAARARLNDQIGPSS